MKLTYFVGHGWHSQLSICDNENNFLLLTTIILFPCVLQNEVGQQ